MKVVLMVYLEGDVITMLDMVMKATLTVGKGLVLTFGPGPAYHMIFIYIMTILFYGMVERLVGWRKLDFQSAV